MTAYDFELFALQRLDEGTWVDVECAAVTYSASYDPDARGTLIIGSEAIHITWNAYGEITSLQPLDVVRISYDGDVIGTFTVDSVATTVAVDPDAVRHGGETVTSQCAVSAVGSYAAAQDVIVSWLAPLDFEHHPLATIQRWVNVTNWPGG